MRWSGHGCRSMTPVATRRWDRRGFWGLIAAQFLGAFNDNAWKNLLQSLAVATIADSVERDGVIALAMVVFIVPGILFSMHAGSLADRFSKRSALIASKLFEIVVMALGVAAFLSGGSFPLLMAVLFLLSTQSTYYSPAKYGVLPEVLPPERLSWGNGILEMTTFAGIIFGMVAGTWPVLFFKPAGAPVAGSSLWQLALILTAIAVVGSAASFLLKPIPAADPNRRVSLNPFADVRAQWRTIAGRRVIGLTVLGIVYFWSLAALLNMNLYSYGKEALQLPEKDFYTTIGYLLMALSGGIGLGSAAAGYLSGKTIELGLVPLGALGLSASSTALYFTTGSFAWTAAALAALGFSGGLFIVPLNSLLQELSPPAEKGRLIAATNIGGAFGMLLAAGLFTLLKSVLRLDAPLVFLVCGLGTLAGTAYVLRLLPEALGRLLLWLFTHSIYRVKVLGRENLPDRGPALLVSNHVSYVDGLLILAATHRFIRFVMYKAIADLPIVRHLARFMKVIPISAEEGPKAIITAFKAAAAALEKGELVCLFPEGQISRTGQMLPFRKGFERILKDVDAPVIPVHLDRVWGSIFSFQGGRFVWKRPRRWLYPVTVSFGKPLSRTASTFEVRQAVMELGTAAFGERARDLEPLHRTFIRNARRARRRQAIADSTGVRLTYFGALGKSIAIARRLAPRWESQEMVGILLPPSSAAALANVAALLSGCVPVNLNYTAPAESLRSAAKQCELRTVVTSRAFLEKFPVSVPAEAIYLEDLAAVPPTAGEKLRAALLALLAPARCIERACGGHKKPDVNATAAILFSSGSTGEPKGVMLSHANILSNILSLEELFDPGPEDRVMGVLPLFHSFGLMATLWYPLVTRIGAVYHSSPLDAAAIGQMVREHRCTYLLATPTFLQTYTRRCEPASFGSLRHVVVGAEKLTDRVADAFRDRFGIEPLEGYGLTECSPLVAVNVPDHREPGIYQVGKKRGHIGHPIPAVSIRIVDPESFQPIPQGWCGLLLVNGPNVMQGYLGRPDLTAAVIRDGWYVTGDIAAVDEDGFITITDRLSRFSKIGGEMVPHIKIEEALHDALGAAEQMLAVTGVPDGLKGERLAVVHRLEPTALAALQEKLPSLGLPNLWLPRRDAFVHVEALPVLGTGKLDLRAVRELAKAAVGGGGG